MVRSYTFSNEMVRLIVLIARVSAGLANCSSEVHWTLSFRCRTSMSTACESKRHRSVVPVFLRRTNFFFGLLALRYYKSKKLALRFIAEIRNGGL